MQLRHAPGIAGVVDQVIFPEPLQHRLDGGLHVAPAPQRRGDLPLRAGGAVQAAQRGLIGVRKLHGGEAADVALHVDFIAFAHGNAVKVLLSHAQHDGAVGQDLHLPALLLNAGDDGHCCRPPCSFAENFAIPNKLYPVFLDASSLFVLSYIH